MNKNNQNTSSGVTFASLLFLLFLALKLTHVIDWSWWWITAPLWIPFIIVIAVFFSGVIIVFIWSFVIETKYWYKLNKRRKESENMKEFKNNEDIRK